MRLEFYYFVNNDKVEIPQNQNKLSNNMVIDLGTINDVKILGTYNHNQSVYKFIVENINETNDDTDKIKIISTIKNIFEKNLQTPLSDDNFNKFCNFLNISDDIKNEILI